LLNRLQAITKNPFSHPPIQIATAKKLIIPSYAHKIIKVHSSFHQANDQISMKNIANFNLLIGSYTPEVLS